VVREALVHTLAREKRAHGVRVNIVLRAGRHRERVCPVPQIRSLTRPATGHTADCVNWSLGAAAFW